MPQTSFCRQPRNTSQSTDLLIHKTNNPGTYVQRQHLDPCVCLFSLFSQYCTIFFALLYHQFWPALISAIDRSIAKNPSWARPVTDRLRNPQPIAAACVVKRGDTFLLTIGGCARSADRAPCSYCGMGNVHLDTIFSRTCTRKPQPPVGAHCVRQGNPANCRYIDNTRGGVWMFPPTRLQTPTERYI